MPIHQHVKDLLREIEAYCRRKQITRTDFSNRITGGGIWFGECISDNSRGCRRSTASGVT